MNALHFDINHQAWAVLHGVLIYVEEDDTSLNAYPWYNGRERGFVLVQRTGPNEVYCIAFAEARSSDEIVVYDWEGESKINPPTVDDLPEESWQKSKRFKQLQVHKVVDYIYKLLEQYR